MPSETMDRAMEALRSRREAYHSAVATAADEVRALLGAQRAPKNGRGARAAAELGAFATGRIDTDRFAALFGETESLDRAALERIDRALETLTELAGAGTELHRCAVPAGADLRTEVADALGRAGRAFAAGRTVEAVRAGTDRAIPHHAAPFPPYRWNRAERELAPPLVVDLEGADLRPSGLADFLEGGQAIVLLVRPPAPPAALARLVGGPALVVQSRDGAALDLIPAFDGPAIVALVPEGCAEFAFRPTRRGGELVVSAWPEGPVRALPGLTAARQESELDLLRVLEAAIAGRALDAAGAAVPDADPVDPADRLAAWLLRQATIPGPGEA